MLGGIYLSNVLFPTIDLAATGKNIVRLRKACGLTVRDVQQFFGFEEPQAIYKWQQGKSLPTVDNLFALSFLFGVSMNDILVETKLQQNLNSVTANGQSFDCPSNFFITNRFRRNRFIKHRTIYKFIHYSKALNNRLNKNMNNIKTQYYSIIKK